MIKRNGHRRRTARVRLKLFEKFKLNFLFCLHVADKEGKDRDKEKQQSGQLAVPRLSVCADAQKVDRAKLGDFINRATPPDIVKRFLIDSFLSIH